MSPHNVEEGAYHAEETQEAKRQFAGSTLGPLAKALSEINAIKPTEAEPEEPGSGGDGEPAPEGAAEKSEAPSEGETPQEG